MIPHLLVSYHSLETRIVNPHPAFGIFASLGGFVTSLLAVLAHISVFVGFIGAIFGCVAGYFTMRCQYQKWKNLKHK